MPGRSTQGKVSFSIFFAFLAPSRETCFSYGNFTAQQARLTFCFAINGSLY